MIREENMKGGKGAQGLVFSRARLRSVYCWLIMLVPTNARKRSVFGCKASLAMFLFQGHIGLVRLLKACVSVVPNLHILDMFPLKD